MSKAVNNLRQMEKQTYIDWSRSVRDIQEARNKLILADPADKTERKSMLTFYLAAADQAFALWTRVCETLDEIELENHRPTNRA
jgi:hypothetical protein